MIRLTVPTLTEERRKELVKVIHKMAEEGRVDHRNHRPTDANDALKKMEKAKQCRVEVRKGNELIQDVTNKMIKEPGRTSWPEGKGDHGVLVRPAGSGGRADHAPPNGSLARLLLLLPFLAVVQFASPLLPSRPPRANLPLRLGSSPWLCPLGGVGVHGRPGCRRGPWRGSGP